MRFPPPAVLFRPVGIPSSHLRHVLLTLDEYEALRLVDHSGLDQAAAAVELGVSRATCARILESARRKIADAVVNGCAIKIEGGSYRFARNRYRCFHCGNIWELEFENTLAPEKCPACLGINVIDLAERVGWRGGQGGQNRGRRGFDHPGHRGRR